MDEARLKAAIFAAKGIEDEGKAIAQYLDQVLEMLNSNLENKIMKELKLQYEEIIADELNHAARFCSMVLGLTEIEINKE